MLFPNANVIVNPLLLVLLGVIVGTLGGFFGVGGGFLITGGLLVFGVPPLFTVGTGLTLIMGSSIINVLKHRNLGNLDFRLGLLTIGGTVPALFLAERLNVLLESAGIAEPVIGFIYVGLLTFFGIFILYDYLKTRKGVSNSRDKISTARLAHRLQDLRIPSHSILFPGMGRVSMYTSLPVSAIESVHILVPIAMGFGVGFLAGLLGAGDGFILLPILIFVLGVPTAIAVGTGLLQIIVTGAIGTVLYSLSNHVDLLMAVIMLAAASAGSQLGATATRFVDASRIRILFGVTVLSASIAIALKQISENVASPDFLDAAASIILLGVSGAIVVVIGALLLQARRVKTAMQQAESSVE